MEDAPTPDSLAPGDIVGPWRLDFCTGRGAYGVVYRARRAGHPQSEPVALKLALLPDDPRFVREVKLLSLIEHPAVPRFVDRCWWRTEDGQVHPYVVMQVQLPPQAQITKGWPRLTSTVVVMLVMVGLWSLPRRPVSWQPEEEAPTVAEAEAPDAGVSRDGGTADLGDTAMTSRAPSQDSPDSSQLIALEVPEEPLDGQRRAPCRRGESEINGGCWWPLLTLAPPCGEEAYEWKGICYLPRYEKKKLRPPTTDDPP